MKALTHITVGRTAIRALLVAVVVTAGVVGTSGMAAAEPMDGKGNDPYPPTLYSLDGKGNDVYPPPGVYASRATAGVVDEPGGDVVISALPIDDVTRGVDYVGRGGGSGKPSF
jgi:hypothetical protein